MVDQNPPGTNRITLDADKAYDTADFIATCRALSVTHMWLLMTAARPARRWTDERCGIRLSHQPSKSAAGRGDLVVLG